MKNKENLLTENEFRLVLRYIIPSMGGMVGMSLYIFADTFFIANGIGNLGLTSLNIALPLFSIFTGTGLLIGIGGA
ncbi:MAG: MATE family efflux transporter, partial [Clostridium sp.]